jgi:hypothetical protein
VGQTGKKAVRWGRVFAELGMQIVACTRRFARASLSISLGDIASSASVKKQLARRVVELPRAQSEHPIGAATGSNSPDKVQGQLLAPVRCKRDAMTAARDIERLCLRVDSDVKLVHTFKRLQTL